MVAAKIIRPFGHAFLSRLFPRPRAGSANRQTGERCRAGRSLDDRRFQYSAEEICSSARQIVAANDVHVFSNDRGNCGERTCRSDSIFELSRVYPGFGESIARKDAEIRRICSIAKKITMFCGEICFSRTAEIVVYTCSIFGVGPVSGLPR